MFSTICVQILCTAVHTSPQYNWTLPDQQNPPHPPGEMWLLNTQRLTKEVMKEGKVKLIELLFYQVFFNIIINLKSEDVERIKIMGEMTN